MKANSLRCENCGSRNTVIVSKKEVAEVCKNPGIMSAKKGKIDQGTIIKIIALIGEIFLALLSIFKDNNQKIILCKDCGYWKDF